MTHEKDMLVYGLGMTMMDQIGPTRAKQLIAHCGGLAEVFELPARDLRAITGIRPTMAEAVITQRAKAIEQAKHELDALYALGGQCLLYHDMHYPQRLKECEDAPMVVYYKGRMELNAPRVLSVVGTRSATPYGRYFCDQMMEALAPLGVTVISGLAFGIDALAHKAALRNGLPTVACVAHGLHTIYPAEHKALSEQMLEHGGVLTEFTTTQKICAEMFPMRNRLIAGLADATVVVESDLRGGSMITAYLAHSYNREVFALPGRIDERGSLGCNDLIRRQVAGMLTAPDTIIEAMGWNVPQTRPQVQLRLFDDLSPTQEQICKGFEGQPAIGIDELAQRTGLSGSHLASALLEMEFDGMVRSRPGNRYELLARWV